MDIVEDDELGYLDLPPTSAPRSTAMQEIPMPPIPLDTSYSTVAFAESPLVPRLVDATRAAAQDEASATSRPFLDDSLIDPQLLRQAIPAPSSEKASGQSNESELRQELEFYQSRAELQSGSGASWLGDLGKSFLDAFQRRDEFDFQECAFDPIIFERDISLDARDGVVYPDGSGASFWSDVEHIALSILKRQVVYCVPRVQIPYRQ
ncbi:hypothetical protein B0H21DRAFT_828185 [Amylocystis lapponica]|nr:hypothetical protein B0H21DRAFT_828185 [Amylocystis lapponica]